MVNNIEKNWKHFSVKGKIIAIIGSTGILGRQYVKYLTKHGATVIIGDINLESCQELHLECKKKGGKTKAIEVDNTSEESLINFFLKIKKEFGRCDVLINNAQIKPEGFYDPFESYRKNTLMQVIDGNLVGVTIACREACKIYLKQNGGVIVNISSVYGLVAPDQRLYDDVKNIYNTKNIFSSPVSYALSKAGVIQLTRYLASYYREKNIRINCLTPGGVYDNHDTKFSERYAYRTTVGRMAEKDEYNGAILFLCSDASSYMSGANLVIDGGWSAL